MSTTPVTTEAGKGAEFLPAVRPDHTTQLGTAGATLSVVDAAVVNSDPAPTEGMVIVSLPAGSAAAVRIGASAVAVANDQRYFGPNAWHFPIFTGERVSLFGVGSSFDASVSMALNRG